MSLRIGRVGADRLLRQLNGALEQSLLLAVSGDVVAVYRQRFGRQRISFGGFEGFGELGGLDESAFSLCGARRFDRLGAGGVCQQKQVRDRQAGQEYSFDHRICRSRSKSGHASLHMRYMRLSVSSLAHRRSMFSRARVSCRSRKNSVKQNSGRATSDSRNFFCLG